MSLTINGQICEGFPSSLSLIFGLSSEVKLVNLFGMSMTPFPWSPWKCFVSSGERQKPLIKVLSCHIQYNETCFLRLQKVGLLSRSSFIWSCKPLMGDSWKGLFPEKKLQFSDFSVVNAKVNSICSSMFSCIESNGVVALCSQEVLTHSGPCIS